MREWRWKGTWKMGLARADMLLKRRMQGCKAEDAEGRKEGRKEGRLTSNVEVVYHTSAYISHGYSRLSTLIQAARSRDSQMQIAILSNTVNAKVISRMILVNARTIWARALL